MDKKFSLGVDCRRVVGIYAHGQWYEVLQGSVSIDACIFVDWQTDLQGFSRGTEYVFPVKQKKTPNEEHYAISFISKAGSCKITIPLAAIQGFSEI